MVAMFGLLPVKLFKGCQADSMPWWMLHRREQQARSLPGAMLISSVGSLRDDPVCLAVFKAVKRRQQRHGGPGKHVSRQDIHQRSWGILFEMFTDVINGEPSAAGTCSRQTDVGAEERGGHSVLPGQGSKDNEQERKQRRLRIDYWKWIKRFALLKAFTFIFLSHR